jgi:AraC-like DNA-binding protein
LKQVHDVLSTAPPGSTTVTEVALDWGFIHLGEFAARYRARFGVKPSDVLAKRR